MKNINSLLATRFPILKEVEPLRAEFNPLSSDELAGIEKLLNTRLPETYRELLLGIGGFGVSALFRTIEESYGGSHEVIKLFFGAKSEGDDYWLWRNIKDHKGTFSDNLIPIGGDYMGHLVCLGIAGKERGKVYFYDRDIGKACLAAESFEDFLNKLEIEED